MSLFTKFGTFALIADNIIFGYLDIQDLIMMRLVNSYYRKLADSSINGRKIVNPTQTNTRKYRVYGDVSSYEPNIAKIVNSAYITEIKLHSLYYLIHYYKIDMPGFYLLKELCNNYDHKMMQILCKKYIKYMASFKYELLESLYRDQKIYYHEMFTFFRENYFHEIPKVTKLLVLDNIMQNESLLIEDCMFHENNTRSCREIYCCGRLSHYIMHHDIDTLNVLLKYYDKQTIVTVFNDVYYFENKRMKGKYSYARFLEEYNDVHVAIN